MRHAKAADPGSIADLDRPLSETGRRQCELIAAHIEAAGFKPGVLIQSPALRVFETVNEIWDAVSGAERVIEPRAYEAGCGALFELIGEHAGKAKTVMVVGHNPAIAQATSTLAGGASPVDAPTDFPSASLAVLEIDATWAGLEPGVGRLTSFVRAAELG